MSYIMVDIEADGPVPGDYSMLSVGAVLVDHKLDKTFYRQLKPIAEKNEPARLDFLKLSREETLAYEDPREVMLAFDDWVREHSKGRTFFISDNNGFDYMFVCWYFHHFIGKSPFWMCSHNLSDLYKGLSKDTFANHKHLRKTPITHNALDDAKGNAEALVAMKDELGLIITIS